MTADEIREGLRYCANGKHGDGDLRLVTEYLSDIADLAEGDAVRTVVMGSVYGLEDALQLVRQWLSGDISGRGFFKKAVGRPPVED